MLVLDDSVQGGTKRPNFTDPLSSQNVGDKVPPLPPLHTLNKNSISLPGSLQGHTDWEEAVLPRVPPAREVLRGDIHNAGEVLGLCWRI